MSFGWRKSWGFKPVDAKEKKKIALVGLDNAGKSTIILTMKGNLGPHIYKELDPTKGLQTETFETNEISYHVFDFGGQEAYRERYLQKPDFFAETDSFIFVIDIQDADRYDLALAYLSDILQLLNELDEPCECSIFFHKFDPELLESDEYQQRSTDLRKRIRDLFKKYSFPLKVFHTSIYTVFQRIQVM